LKFTKKKLGNLVQLLCKSCATEVPGRYLVSFT
jgi:hypothetical protein